MQEPGPSKSGHLTRPTKKVIHYFLAKNITLNEAENAWVPNCKRGKDEQQSSDDVDAQIEKTKNSVRSLMNKITQDNMDTITEKIMSLPINTYACLTSIIELVFEKAIAEPGFAPQYAGLCQAMQDVKVLSNDGNMKESFKSLLLSTCQKTFNQMNENERKAEKLLLDIESCQDMETKKRLGMKYEETEHNNRRRSVGNSRFMCELFKVKILKQRMLKKCINHLSNSRKEEQLECLCNILKNVGRNLDLTTTFQKLEELLLVKNRNIIPTRIRFMIMDTIDLKNNGWLSRNADKMLSSPQGTIKENSNIQPEISETVEKQKNNAFSWDETNTKFDSKIIKKYNEVQKERQFIDKKDKCPTVDHIYQPTQQSGPSNYDYSTTGTRKEVTQDSLSNESMTLPMTENTLVTKCKVPIDEHQTADRNDTISTVEYTNQQTSTMKENSNIQTENLGTVEKQKNNAFSWDQTNTKFESKIIKKYNVFEKERIYRDKKNKSPTVDHIFQQTNYNAFTWNQTNHKFESKIIKKYNPFQKESHYIDKKDKSPTVDHIYQPTQESGPSNYEYSTTVTRKKVTQDSLSNESMTLPMTENTWVTKCKVAKDEHQSADMNNIKPTFEYAYQPTSSMNKNSNIQPKILETAEKQSINTDKDLIRTSEDQKFNISDFFYPLINTILQIGILWCKN